MRKEKHHVDGRRAVKSDSTGRGAFVSGRDVAVTGGLSSTPLTEDGANSPSSSYSVVGFGVVPLGLLKDALEGGRSSVEEVVLLRSPICGKVVGEIQPISIYKRVRCPQQRT
jgi:hypothetical protein